MLSKAGGAVIAALASFLSEGLNDDVATRKRGTDVRVLDAGGMEFRRFK
jgi:hypothetical protein